MTIRWLTATALALAACVSSSTAFAGVQSFVSVKGTDAGTCASVTAPCRTFAYAHNQTSAGGEILALDAGDYGPVTITKSLSITGAVPGAGVLRGDAIGLIDIRAGTTGVVDLTGLTLDGLNASYSGVVVLSAAAVTIKASTIRNFLGNSVALAGPVGQYLVEDLSVTKISASGVRCSGVCAINRVSINDAGNAGIEIGTTDARVTVSEAKITGGDRGTAGFMRLNRSVATGNNVGLNDAVDSAGDNFVRGNATDLGAAPNVVGKQ